MPRREILTAAERLELFAIPEEEAELIRLYTLTKPDLAFVRQHRGQHNRLYRRPDELSAISGPGVGRERETE